MCLLLSWNSVVTRIPRERNPKEGDREGPSCPLLRVPWERLGKRCSSRSARGRPGTSWPWNLWVSPWLCLRKEKPGSEKVSTKACQDRTVSWTQCQEQGSLPPHSVILNSALHEKKPEIWSPSETEVHGGFQHILIAVEAVQEIIRWWEAPYRALTFLSNLSLLCLFCRCLA